MKELDELIEDMTAVQSLYEIGRRQDYETVADALLYLREYKEQKRIIQTLAKMTQRMLYWVAEDGYPFDKHEIENILWDYSREFDDGE